MAPRRKIPRTRRDEYETVDDEPTPTQLPSDLLQEDGEDEVDGFAAGVATDQAQSISSCLDTGQYEDLDEVDMAVGRKTCTNELNSFDHEHPQSHSPQIKSMGDNKVTSSKMQSSEGNHDKIDTPPFTWLNILCSIFSIGSYIFDVGSDIWVAYMYYKNRHWWWFGLTTTFVIVPAFIMTIFSLKWYIEEHKDDKLKNKRQVSHLWWASRFIFLFLQLAPLMRYIDTLIYGWKSKKIVERNHEKRHWYDMMIYEDTDSALLRLFECFMEAAPQLILQLYVMTKLGTLSGTVILIGQSISAVTSLASLAWSLVAYHKALRCSVSKKTNMKYSGMAVQFLWRYFTIGARILAIAMFASSYQVWVLVIVGGHWLMMFIWILVQDTKFCHSKIEEIFFNVVVALVYIFCYFNLVEGHTRLRYFFFDIVTYAENAALIFMWYFSTKSEDLWYHLPAVVIVMGGFFVGIFFQLLYYLKFHPNNCSQIHTNIKSWVSFGELCSRSTPNGGPSSQAANNIVNERTGSAPPASMESTV